MPVFQLPPGSDATKGSRRSSPRYSYGNERHASVYKSSEWARFRALIIVERGERCEDKDHHSGTRIARLDLDHIVELQDGGAAFNPANVLLRCRACHGRKTAKAKKDRETREFWEQRAGWGKKPEEL